MTERVRILIEQAKQLTPEERADVLDALLALQGPVEGGDAAWAEEAERRLCDVRAGTTELLDAEQVLAELRQRLP